MWPAAPWTRAPLLAARYSPGTFLACALAGAVLSAAAASGPLFLASTATAALHDQGAQACPESSQPAITDDAGAAAYPSAVQAPTQLAASDARVRAATTASGAAGPYRVSSAVVPVGRSAVNLFDRAGSSTHVTVVAGRPGLLVPATYAAAHRVGVGSVLPIGATHHAVTGVYRDLAPSAFVPLFALPRYWCTWTDDIVPTPLNRPPPMFLVDDAVLVAAGGPVTSTWYDPVPVGRRTVAEAATAVARTRAAVDGIGVAGFRFTSDLPGDLDRAARVRAGVRGPVLPAVVASIVVAALLVAAAGFFWGLRREREVRLLGARGVGRLAIGVKAALELAPALALGLVAGWLAALGVVRAVGPAARFEPGAPGRALLAAALAAGAAVVLVGAAGARTVRSDRLPTARTWPRRVPWELVLLAAGVACYLQIRHTGAVRIVGATVQVNPLVTAYPLIALTGAVLLVGRGAARGVPALGRVHPRSTAAYLATRRIGRSPAVAVGVLVAVALPVAVFVYSMALSGSTQRDVTAKYRSDVGAPQAIGLLTHGVDPRPGTLGTVVGLIDSGVRTDTGSDVALEGVDPADFARYAYGGSSLRPAMRTLRTPAAAVLVNAPPGTEVRSVQVGNVTLPVRVSARRDSFPGLRDPYRPMLVVDRRRLPAADALIDRSDELWTTPQQLTPALHRLSAQGVEADYAITPTTFLSSSGLRPVTWVLGYLRAIALLTAATGLAGLGIAFATRTARRARAYHLARRMGMSRATHARSVLAELGALVATSWLVGAGLAVGAVASVYRLADPYPAFPPRPGFPSVAGSLTTTALGAALTVLVGVGAVQRLTDRSNAQALLRG